MTRRRPEQPKSQEEEEEEEVVVVQEQQQRGNEEEETPYPAGPSTDLCQALIHRYSTSSSPHHLHLTAAATSFRSILQSSSLPLTPSSYFAAAISTLQQSHEDRTLTSEELSAMLSFLSIVLPMVPDDGVSATIAKEAVGVLVQVAGKDGLGVGSLVCVVKCVGVLLVMFCDKEDWGSVEEGFRVLLVYLLDRRPKVRRSAQECLEKVFKSFQSSTVLRKASEMVLSAFEKYMPEVASPIDASNEERTMLKPMCKSENKEFLHMLKFTGAVFPNLNAKVRSQIVTKVHNLISCLCTASTAVILKIIEAFLGSQIDGDASSDIESIIITISAYVTMTDDPDDIILSAANLLKVSLDKLHSRGSVLWIKYLPIVCHSIAGLLAKNSGTALVASRLLRDTIKQLVDQDTFLFDDSPSQGGIQESFETSAMTATCATFENALGPLDEVPNPHLLSVISALFLMLGKSSYFYMKSLIIKLAHFLNDAQRDQSSTVHVRSCIGYAVAAIGVERMLGLFPIELYPNDFTYKNVWMLPILRDYVVSSSLAYYMDHIVPLAKSFGRASQKEVSDPSLSKDLQSHASELWKLFPAFCRNAIDTSKQYCRLAELLVDLLKEHPLMHETVAHGLQVLVNQNKGILGLQKVSGKLDFFPVEKSIMEIQERSGFSKKSAARNIKAIASASSEVFRVLSKLYFESDTGSKSYLKDAIGCLASIADSSLTKEIFMSLLQTVNLGDGGHKVKKPKHHENPVTDKELECTVTATKDANRCHLMELACSIVEGAKEDLLNLIFSFIKDMMQEDNDIGHREAYLTLCRIVQEHPWFCTVHYVELMDFLFGVKSPSNATTLRSRFTCFHALMVYSLGRNVEGEEEDARTFLILNELILTLKSAKDELRKEAYDMLRKLSSTLKGMEPANLTTPDHKLVNMIMGYLSSPSPQIKSGAVSALSVLVFNDANICVSIPDLVPSLLSLLENKAVEVTKAILGFVKVLVSSLQARELHNLLSEVVSGILPWSDVSRHHFRSKVTIIVEIIIRKCGRAAVQTLTPDKYGGFLKRVIENRHSRTAKEDSTILPASSADLPSKRIHEEPVGSKKDSMDQRKRKRSENNRVGANPKDNFPFAGAGGSERLRRKSSAGSQLQRTGNKGKRKFNQVRHGQNQIIKQKVRFRKVEGNAPVSGDPREAKKTHRGGKAGFRKYRG